MNRDRATTRAPDPAITDAAARRAAWIAGAAALALYLATNQPFVRSGDPGQFQVMAATGGIAHSGYPTVVMLMQLFGRLPISTMAFRANLLSCLAGAAAVAMLAWTAARMCGNWMAGVIAALAFATGRTMWKESTEAGVHAPAIALNAALFVLALAFDRRPTARGALSLGLLGALALLTHLSSLALALIMLAVAIHAALRSMLRPSHVALALLGFTLGLTPLLYTFAMDRPAQRMNYIEDILRLEPAELVRSTPMPVTRWQRIEWLMSGVQYRDYPHPPASDRGVHTRRAITLAGEVVFNQFPLWGAPLAVFGLLALRRRRTPQAWLPVLLVAGSFALAIAVVDGWILSFFFLPGMWAMSVLIAAGLDALLKPPWRAAGWLAAALLLSAPWIRLSMTRPPAPLDRYTLTRVLWSMWPAEWNPLRRDRDWDTFGRGVMRELPPNAAVMTTWGEGNVLRYFLYAEQLRGDVEVVHTTGFPLRTLHAEAMARAEGRPVFATYPPDSAMSAAFEFTPIARWPACALWRVRPVLKVN
ncbi:MAG: protein O-mannosyl-transferase family [Candidatus Eiseniibacteriota bacterium]